MSDSLIQQQIAYYRARAGEYDEWFYRLGRYDRGAENNQAWFAEVELLMQRLHHLGPVDTTLEFAAGTGIWTHELAKISRHVSALDASQEVLDINRAKLNNPPHITYQQADIFAWHPEKTYDLVAFTFWLSHVPSERLDDFLATVQQATRVGGKIFMVDSRRVQSGTAHNQHIQDQHDPIQQRLLNDGSVYQIVKIYYEPAFLHEKFTQFGFDVEAAFTDTYFVYVIGTKR